MTPIRTLTCAVCGARCKGRQWFNRDTGYGICGDCIAWFDSDPARRPQGDERRRLYGDPGVHYFTNDQKNK